MILLLAILGLVVVLGERRAARWRAGIIDGYTFPDWSECLEAARVEIAVIEKENGLAH